jgi:predicted TPR repeat methyltransferase
MISLFISSGNLTADRRYEFAKELEKRGDLDAAAELYAQTVEMAPGFASAWFAFGELLAKLGRDAKAAEAFRKAAAADPDDRHGAAVQLARLIGGVAPMPAGYVRTLFDQYARHFDLSLLEGLQYRGPSLLHDAVMSACAALDRKSYFDRAIDLGCGTGLAGAVFAPRAASLTGIDLSPAMIERARETGHYSSLQVGGAIEYLALTPDRGAGIVIAADSLPYCCDLGPLAEAVARVLDDNGLFAFTVETHDDDGVILRDTLRYAHGADHVRAALANAGLSCVSLTAASARKENDIPVPGLVVVAAKPASTVPSSPA